jgi:hypothetical protein
MLRAACPAAQDTIPQIPPRPAPVMAKAVRDFAKWQPSSPLLLAGPALGLCRDALAILSGKI